ncbi:MAG: histidine phosphatase family protein [Akkermansia sp.]
MAKKLIIVRHGNTFLPGESPTRVGAHTDLPLVEEHRARSVGKYLLAQGICPDLVYAAPLKRTMQTAQLMMDELDCQRNILPQSDFTEIDYGPDENKVEEQVIERIGRDALDKLRKLTSSTTPQEIQAEGERRIGLWNTQAIAPNGWIVNVDGIISAWQHFAQEMAPDQTVVIVSSNGIIRFAPRLLKDYDTFCTTHDLKVVTGSVGIFEEVDGEWICKQWGMKPYKLYDKE